MTDPDKNVVDLITEVLREYQEQENHEDLPVFCGFVAPDRSVYFSYTNCAYGDLRAVSDAFGDEATLRMIAVNQDRLQRFIDEDDNNMDGGEHE